MTFPLTLSTFTVNGPPSEFSSTGSYITVQLSAFSRVVTFKSDNLLILYSWDITASEIALALSLDIVCSPEQEAIAPIASAAYNILMITSDNLPNPSRRQKVTLKELHSYELSVGRVR